MAEADEVYWVDWRIRTFLSELAKLSQDNPPPGTNAASGHFRNAVDNAFFTPGGKLEGYITPLGALQGDARKLWAVFEVFFINTRRAFHENGNYDRSWTGNLNLFITVLNDMGDHVLNIGSDIYNYVSSDDTAAREAAAQRLAHDAQAAANHTRDRGPVYHGAHANGHISEFERDAATWALDRLNAEFHGDFSGVGGPSARVLAEMFTKIQNLQTQGHNPWLLPSWQIEFQYICQAGSDALREVSPPAPPPSP